MSKQLQLVLFLPKPIDIYNCRNLTVTLNLLAAFAGSLSLARSLARLQKTFSKSIEMKKKNTHLKNTVKMPFINKNKLFRKSNESLSRQERRIAKNFALTGSFVKQFRRRRLNQLKNTGHPYWIRSKTASSLNLIFFFLTEKKNNCDVKIDSSNRRIIVKWMKPNTICNGTHAHTKPGQKSNLCTYKKKASKKKFEHENNTATCSN